MTHGKQKATSIYEVELKGEFSNADVISRSVAKDYSNQSFEANIIGANICNGHAECDAIIMDQPSYGRGPKGEIWKIEDMIHPLIKLCTKILSKDALFFLVNSYTTGLAPAVLTYMISLELKQYKGHVEAQEIGLPVKSTGLVLPCGASGRWQSDNV